MAVGEPRSGRTAESGVTTFFCREDAEAVVSWFRSNRGKVTWVALFALTCQLVLAFGHVHLIKIRSALAPISAATAIVIDMADDPAALPRSPPQIPQRNPSGFGDNFCALCGGINLAASVVVPTAPTVVPPISSDRALTWSSAGLQVATSGCSFVARGPPQA